ncbi:hypothetical protein LXL04_020866 [Taraxacum kok-saghyz]
MEMRLVSIPSRFQMEMRLGNSEGISKYMMQPVFAAMDFLHPVLSDSDLPSQTRIWVECDNRLKFKGHNGLFLGIFVQEQTGAGGIFVQKQHRGIMEKCGQCDIMRIPKQINKITRLAVISKRYYWSPGFPKRNHSPNKTVVGASRGYPTIQMRTIIGFENGRTNLGHLFHFAADQFSVAGALPSTQHITYQIIWLVAFNDLSIDLCHLHTTHKKASNPTHSIFLSIPGFENTATVFKRFPAIEPLDHHDIVTEGAQDIYEGSDRRDFDSNG